jgi:hypothetical protein
MKNPFASSTRASSAAAGDKAEMGEAEEARARTLGTSVRLWLAGNGEPDTAVIADHDRDGLVLSPHVHVGGLTDRTNYAGSHASECRLICEIAVVSD